MRIAALEYYLPAKVLTNTDLEQIYYDWSASKIEDKTGIRERHISAKDETSVDMACLAAERLFETVDRRVVDCLILCTQTPDYYLPASACVIHGRLGLSTTVAALDINQGCSGFIYGLAVAKGMVCAGISRNVLLATADTYTKVINDKDRSTRTIFGDAATATLIDNSEGLGIGEFVLGTDGKGFRNLIVPNGGLRHRYDSLAPEIAESEGAARTENNLYMNGPEIFNFTIKAVPEAFHSVLAANHTSKERIDYFIFHQANKFMIDYLRKKLAIPSEKFCINLAMTGNTVSSTIPIALKESLLQGRIKRGDKVMLLGFGVGYSWGGTVIDV